MVQVWSHSRHRQTDVTVMIFASVSMILPLQKGHIVGRVTFSGKCESGMVLLAHVGGFLTLRLFKSEQHRCARAGRLPGNSASL